jgi:hypothetical protein
MRKQDSATAMNRREMLKLSAVAAFIDSSVIPDKTQAIQAVTMKPMPGAVSIADISFKKNVLKTPSKNCRTSSPACNRRSDRRDTRATCEVFPYRRWDARDDARRLVR